MKQLVDPHACPLVGVCMLIALPFVIQLLVAQAHIRLQIGSAVWVYQP